MRPRPILLVEDNAKDAELILAAFEGCDLPNQIIVVSNGAEALDYLHAVGKFIGRSTGDPAVVLLDFEMPKTSGLETLAKIRADPAISVVPVVMLTSSNEESDIARSYEQGANAYVVKPRELGRFLETVQRLGIFWGYLNSAPPSKLRP